MTYDLIENLLKNGRLHMSGVAGCNPRMVCPILGAIWAATGEAKDLHWPDPAAEKAAAAKRDRTLQKVIKNRVEKPVLPWPAGHLHWERHGRCNELSHSN